MKIFSNSDSLDNSFKDNMTMNKITNLVNQYNDSLNMSLKTIH